MRNALAHAGKQGRRVVAAFIATAFAQDDAKAAKAQWRQVADQLRRGSRSSPSFMDEAESDVLAYMSFPPAHRQSCTRRMRSISLSAATCYPGAARATARRRAGIEDASPAAQPSASLLLCGARAPIRIAAPLPLAGKALVGLLGMAGELNLPVTQLLDVIGIGGRRACCLS